jgi:hypothetical protein
LAKAKRKKQEENSKQKVFHALGCSLSYFRLTQAPLGLLLGKNQRGTGCGVSLPLFFHEQVLPAK